MISFEPRYDVIVVGARVAGASTAMLLARAGLRVLAVDRADEGSDTLSTHALMRGGVLQLHRWGILPGVLSAGTPPIRATAFHYGDESVEVAIKARDGVDALYAPRRTVLDPLLVAAARRAGARVEHGVRVRGLVQDGAGRVRGVHLEAGQGAHTAVVSDLVIGADGLRSQIAEWTGAPTERVGRHATGVLYGYWRGLAADGEGYQWYYRSGVSVGSIPTNEGLTCLFVAVPATRLRAALTEGRGAAYGRLLREADPNLARRIEGAERVGLIRSFPGLPGYLRRAHGPGWALVGDAGFFRDPLTAHGITDSLRDAEILASAVTRGGPGALADYQVERDSLAVEMMEITDRIASFEWNLDGVRELHLALSRSMARETERIAALPGIGSPPALVSADGLR